MPPAMTIEPAAITSQMTESARVRMLKTAIANLLGGVGRGYSRRRGCYLAPARFMYYLYWAMSISVTPKKRGRPATGRDPLVTARLPKPLVDALNACAAAEEKTRSEVLREAASKHLKQKGYLK